jgi:hypothetical protein
MRLTSATLADHAEVLGGKLYVMGAAFDTIYVRSVPAIHKKLHLVLIAEIEPEERLRDLKLRVDLLDEDGDAVGVQADGTLRIGAPANMKPGQKSIVPLQIPFENLRLPAAKLYSFRVAHGEQELARVPFSVQLRDASA